MRKMHRVEVGQRFGRLIVIETGLRWAQNAKTARGHSGRPAARVRCDCGTIRQVEVRSLIVQYIKSCGCLKTETDLMNLVRAGLVPRSSLPRPEAPSREWKPPAAFLAYLAHSNPAWASLEAFLGDFRQALLTDPDLGEQILHDSSMAANLRRDGHSVGVRQVHVLGSEERRALVLQFVPRRKRRA